MKFLLQSILLFCLAALIAGLAYIAFTNAYAYKQTARQLYGLQRAITAAPLWKYATVQSVNASSASMVIQFNTEKLFQVQVPANTYIARQDLIGENGIYTAAATPTPATLADIQPGDNIFIIIAVDQDGTRIASMILFGNPL